MASFWILSPELMTGAKKKPKSPGLIIWLLVFWPLEARGWGILTWSHSRRVSWVIRCSYMFLEEMREMTPIVVGMTEPLAVKGLVHSWASVPLCIVLVEFEVCNCFF
jgi:hypothetical protein